MAFPTPRRRAAVPLSALAIALLAASQLPLALPAHAADDDTIGVSARPGAADGSSDGRTRFSYQLDPGQQVDDVVVIVNSGSAVEHFTVYGTDAFNSDEGEFSLLPTDEEPVMVGSWVRFENDEPRIEFDLQPGEGRVVPFRVEVPPQAPPGDHAGGIVASVLTPGDQVNVDRRVAVRLYTRISGDIQPILTISSVAAQYNGDWWNPLGGTVTLRYTVQNTGNIALAANAATGVRTWFDIEAATTVHGTVDEILPGYSRELETEIAGVGQWGYLASFVTLNPYVDDPVNAELQLTVAETSRETTSFAMPWVLLIVIVVIILIVLIARLRRRLDAKRAEAWAAYTKDEATRLALEESAEKASAKSSTVG